MLISVFLTFIVTIKKIVSASLRCHWLFDAISARSFPTEAHANVGRGGGSWLTFIFWWARNETVDPTGNQWGHQRVQSLHPVPVSSPPHCRTGRQGFVISIIALLKFMKANCINLEC